MEAVVNPNLTRTVPPSLQLLGILSSLFLVAWGQPARLGWLGALAAVFGFALFFWSLPQKISSRQRFVAAALWFALVQAVQLSWMTSIEFQGYYILFVYAALALALGAQFGLLTLFVPARGDLSVFKILSLASLWTLMEWARLFFLCGFSWNPVGLALTHFIPSLQFASLLGIYGLTFWALLTNLACLRLLRSSFSLRRFAGVCVLAAVPYLYGSVHLALHSQTGAGVDVALVQTDLLPSEKMPWPGRTGEFISPFVQWKQIVRSLQQERKKSWDLIVLPEAALPLSSHLALYRLDAVQELLIRELGPEVEKNLPPLETPFAEYREEGSYAGMCVSNLYWCQALANHFGAEVVAGLDHSDREEKKNYNSVFYLTAQNAPIQRYDKQILLPLAEYLPLEWLKPLSKSYGISEFFTQGSGAKVFGEKIPFSPSVCYEETFSSIMREGRVKGARLFVNLTNDNYYPNSSLHRQHLYHARVRAVENGIPLIRSCNAGISAMVDSFGRIVSALEGGKEKHVLSGRLATHTVPTLYAWWGDGAIIFLSALLALGLLKKKVFAEPQALLYGDSP